MILYTSQHAPVYLSIFIMEKIYHAKEFWVKKEYCLRTRKPQEKSVFFFFLDILRRKPGNLYKK